MERLPWWRVICKVDCQALFVDSSTLRRLSCLGSFCSAIESEKLLAVTKCILSRFSVLDKSVRFAHRWLV